MHVAQTLQATLRFHSWNEREQETEEKKRPWHPLQGAVPRWLDRSMTLLLSSYMLWATGISNWQYVEDAPGSDCYTRAHCSTKIFLVPQMAGWYLVVDFVG